MVNIKGYSETELKYLKENFTKYTNKQLAEYLGKTVGSISNAARKLELVKQPHKPWTQEEDDYLKANYEKMTSQEIGKKLGRNIHSINARRDVLKLIRNPNWSKDEEYYLINHYREMSYEEIGIVLNRTTQAVDAKCFDMGLYKKDLPWSDDELLFLKKNYTFIQTKELSEIMNRSINGIKLKAERIGLKKYPYYCNYHFFEKIDSEEKAYWLGFLMADGWISKNKKSGAGVVGIELQYRDINHLKKLNHALQGNYKISDRWRPCLLSDSDKKYHQCLLRVFSIVMYNSLIDKGFTNNKTFDACFPKIPEEFQRHFIRGYFDGNGTICVSHNYLSVSFCIASKTLKDDLLFVLNGNGITLSDYSYVNEFGTVIYRPQAISKDSKYTLLDYMYKDAHVYLERKYKRYQKSILYRTSSGLASQK